jgi:hypothetical protein
MRHQEEGMTEETVWTIINETIARLPEEVQAFVDRECNFHVYHQGVHGMALHRDQLQDKPWLLMIQSNADAADAHGFVAHEIAHAWLGHQAADAVAEQEMAALELTAAWGFTGAGAGWPEEDWPEDDEVESMKEL